MNSIVSSRISNDDDKQLALLFNDPNFSRKEIGVDDTYYDCEPVVTKSKTFINSFYQFNLNEIKVFEALLSLIDPTIDYTKQSILLSVFINTKDLETITGIEVKNLNSFLGDLVKKLHDPFLFPLDRGDGKPRRNSAGFETVPIAYTCIFDQDFGTFELVVHPKMYPYISAFGTAKIYSKYYYKDLMLFKSKHTARLYQLIASLFNEAAWKESGGNTQLRKVSLPVLYSSLGIAWVTEKEINSKHELTYVAKPSKLTQNVITPSVEELNKNSQYIVSFTPFKSGRRTAGYNITIRKKLIVDSSAETLATIEHDDSTVDKNLKIVTVDGVTPKQLSNMVDKYGVERVTRSAEYLEERIESGGTVDNKLAYLKTILKNDYASLPDEVNAYSPLNRNLSPARKLFLAKILTPAWKDLNDQAKKDVLDYHFDGVIYQVYQYFELVYEQRGSDDALLAVKIEGVIKFLNDGDVNKNYITSLMFL